MNIFVFEQIEPRNRTQGKDGTAYFGYYDSFNLWNFIWDGSSSHIEVEVGGDGESVRYIVAAPGSRPTSLISFENHVKHIIKTNE